MNQFFQTRYVFKLLQAMYVIGWGVISILCQDKGSVCLNMLPLSVVRLLITIISVSSLHADTLAQDEYTEYFP